MPEIKFTHADADTLHEALWEAMERDAAQAAYHAQGPDEESADDAYAYARQAARALRLARLVDEAAAPESTCPQCGAGLDKNDSCTRETCPLCPRYGTDPDEPHYCPTCGQEGAYLGRLGGLDHYRCIGCGGDWPVGREGSPEW